MHVEEEIPLVTTNKCGVWVCGMLESKCKVKMPSVIAKRRHSGFNPTIEDKEKAKVSSLNLTLSNLVGPGKEIFPKKGKSLSSESSDHSNEFIALPRNFSIHDRTRSFGSKQIRVDKTRSCVDESSSPEGVCPDSIQSETVITNNVSYKNPSRSVEGMSNICTTRIIASLCG